MKTIDIHAAKMQLERLVEQAAEGEPFVIAKAGKPMVKVTALTSLVRTGAKRLGFMAGEVSVPDDFDRVGQREVDRIFHG